MSEIHPRGCASNWDLSYGYLFNPLASLMRIPPFSGTHTWINYTYIYIYVYYYILPSGNQTWQLEIHYKWSFVAGKINELNWWFSSKTWRVGPGIPTQAKAKASFDDWGCDEENHIDCPEKQKKNWLKKPHMFHQCFTNVSPTSCRSSPTGHDWALRCVAGPEICIRVSILFSGKVCCNHSGMEPAPRPGQPAEGRHEKNRPGERTSMETHHFLPVPSGHLTICYGIDGPFIDALGCFTYWKCWFSSSLR